MAKSTFGAWIAGSTRRTAEDVFYETGAVRVTSRRIVIGEREIDVADVVAVDTTCGKPCVAAGSALLAGGVALAVLARGAARDGQAGWLILAGLAALVAGFFGVWTLLTGKPSHRVLIRTADGQTARLTSTDARVADELLAAIAKARGAGRG